MTPRSIVKTLYLVQTIKGSRTDFMFTDSLIQSPLDCIGLEVNQSVFSKWIYNTVNCAEKFCCICVYENLLLSVTYCPKRSKHVFMSSLVELSGSESVP